MLLVQYLGFDALRTYGTDKQVLVRVIVSDVFPNRDHIQRHMVTVRTLVMLVDATSGQMPAHAVATFAAPRALFLLALHVMHAIVALQRPAVSAHVFAFGALNAHVRSVGEVEMLFQQCLTRIFSVTDYAFGPLHQFGRYMSRLVFPQNAQTGQRFPAMRAYVPLVLAAGVPFSFRLLQLGLLVIFFVQLLYVLGL